ncbi:hypothetical protein BJ508DRAFT_322906 [Ascobolus immersus RN42]|uniref:Uncharacterized protein n=1 Tax=Ascobolus immersus RN42 TaxID=1160509 RepID=A0A3N4IGX5_ASCIM|nr:hypothetical protein BJ508DRAFT_322906 [Ascobolus immersus RN42]
MVVGNDYGPALVLAATFYCEILSVDILDGAFGSLAVTPDNAPYLENWQERAPLGRIDELNPAPKRIAIRSMRPLEVGAFDDHCDHSISLLHNFALEVFRRFTKPFDHTYGIHHRQWFEVRPQPQLFTIKEAALVRINQPRILRSFRRPVVPLNMEPRYQMEVWFGSAVDSGESLSLQP